MDYHLDGYNMEFKNVIGCKDSTRGIMVYSKSTLQYSLFHPTTEAEEALFLLYKLENNEELLLGSLYRSPSNLASENEALNDIIREISSTSFTHLLLVGDFNYPGIDWDVMLHPNSENSKEFRFIECTRDCFLKQHVLIPTRCRGEATASVLDLVFTRDEDIINTLDTSAAIGKSDHCVVETSQTDRQTDRQTYPFI